jgi:hypothetical protein
LRGLRGFGAARAARRRRYFTTSMRAGDVKKHGTAREPCAVGRLEGPAGSVRERGKRRYAWTAPLVAVKSPTNSRARLPGRAALIEPNRLNGSRIMYQSDITQFINQLKAQKPTLEDEQRRGRALLWDKQPVDLDERARQQTSRVKQTPYVYYQNF